MLDLKEFVHLRQYISDYIDRDGGTHVFRLGEYGSILLRELGYSHEHSSYVGLAISLHDIGKLFVPEELLNKPDKLTEEEFELVKEHTTKGYEIVRSLQSHFFKIAGEVILYHHENWDGSGYPLGLTGESIPLNARVTSVVDVFDSLAHERVYKKPWSVSETVKFIHDNAGKKFDPKVVDAFDNVVHLLAASTIK